MEYTFEDYDIKFVQSSNDPNKLVVFIEEFHSVIELVYDIADAPALLKPKFESQIEYLKETHQPIPKPGDGPAKITFAPTNKIDELGSFIDEFFEKILNTSYATSFVSNESMLDDWANMYCDGKENLINMVKDVYGYDISTIYEKPMYEALAILKAQIT
jgi:hypothetical protein